MLFTCYNFHSNRITNTVIFVKEKDIINVYVNLNNNYNNLRRRSSLSYYRRKYEKISYTLQNIYYKYLLDL